jgi:regulator of sigma E protease
MPSFGSAFDLLLVILGFGLIIFVHELGHFLAARWAGVRVLAFALGFGPAIFSYRKGLGWRRGSSEPEYLALAQSATHSGGGVIVQDGREVFPTEYRLNTLPFGGYVKMLGQEDLNPNAVSQSPDSFQRAAVWKRMVIISAGVVMNIITAGFIFMGVFLVGLKTEPPKVGDLSPGKPAAMALSTTSVGGVKTPLLPGDEIVLINGERPRSFNDLMVATAMGARGRDVELSVKREGFAEPISFSITPERNRMTNLMELGVSPFRSARIVSDVPAAQLPDFIKGVEQRGLVGVRPGMTLVTAGGKPAKSAADMLAAARASGGKPVELIFADDAGAKVAASLTPVPEMQSSLVEVGGMTTSLQHVLGLTPVMAVGDPGRAASQGLKAGDIFVRLGSVEYPTLATGIAEIRARAGGEIAAIVSRASEDGKSVEQPLTLQVSSAGAVGFLADDTGSRTTLVARPPEFRVAVGKASGSEPSPASRLNLRPGSTIKAIGSTPVSTIVELQAALKDQVRQHAKPDGGAAVELQIQAPLAAPGGEPQTQNQIQTIAWELSAAEVASLSALGWTSPISDGIFEPEQFVMKATGPWDAVMTGAHETKRVMVMTYLTFARLFDGTVKVEHLKGPVGIAHVGTVIADKGLIWLLFFMGLISVNLAVINFMPLPIVDGGQFVFLLVEAISGRPVSIAIQNVATIAGLVLIGSVFLIVTFNDVMNLIRP